MYRSICLVSTISAYQRVKDGTLTKTAVRIPALVNAPA